jgi:hypothetical protein
VVFLAKINSYEPFSLKAKEIECQKCRKFHVTSFETRWVKECHPVFDEHCSTQYSKAGHRLLRKQDRESTVSKGNVTISSINGIVWQYFSPNQ